MGKKGENNLTTIKFAITRVFDLVSFTYCSLTNLKKTDRHIHTLSILFSHTYTFKFALDYEYAIIYTHTTIQ